MKKLILTGLLATLCVPNVALSQETQKKEMSTEEILFRGGLLGTTTYVFGSLAIAFLNAGKLLHEALFCKKFLGKYIEKICKNTPKGEGDVYKHMINSMDVNQTKNLQRIYRIHLHAEENPYLVKTARNIAILLGIVSIVTGASISYKLLNLQPWQKNKQKEQEETT